MATITRTIYTCDAAHDCDSENTQPIQFAYEGVEYAADYCEQARAELEAALLPLTQNAQRVGGRKKATTSRGTSGMSREVLDSVRHWARSQGHQVSDRGRVAQSILDAWNALSDSDRRNALGAAASDAMVARAENAPMVEPEPAPDEPVKPARKRAPRQKKAAPETA